MLRSSIGVFLVALNIVLGIMLIAWLHSPPHGYKLSPHDASPPAVSEPQKAPTPKLISDAEGQKPASDWSLSDKISFVVTVAALLQALFLAWTIGVLRRNTKLTERAYVSGGGWFPGKSPAKSSEFQLTINNYGKTPAYVTHVEIGYWSSTDGPLPNAPPAGRRYDLGATVPPGKEGLETDIKLDRANDVAGDIIFGRFFYEDIFAKRLGRRFWQRKAQIRSSGFVLRITQDRVVLPLSELQWQERVTWRRCLMLN
jgi:hypothetical protein